MQDSVTICTNDSALGNFFCEFTKPDLSSETTYSEQLILAFFVMKIKDSRIFNTASSTSVLLFVRTKPFVMFFY